MRPLTPNRLALPAALAVAVVLVPAGMAAAAWQTSGSGTGTAQATTIPVPAVSADCNGVDAVDVSWTTTAATPLVATFVVERSTDDGLTWSTIASVPATADLSYLHSDPALAEATYVYRVGATTAGWLTTSALSQSRVVVAAVTRGPKAGRRTASCT